jgi:hypothetical protein
MTRANPLQNSPFAALPPAFFDANAAGAVTKAFFEAQRMQFDLLLRWQQACTGLQQEMFDQWISHWGGGVPLDG